MLSFPILFREFRVAARYKRTYVARLLFAGLLLLVTLLFLALQAVWPRSSAMGLYLLKSFAWQVSLLLFIFAPAITCGCIADEKKEGTLGLLFLTHLNSADIVLGKFLSKGADLLLLFLSALPFLFVPVLMGGVGWDQAAGVVLTILALLLLTASVGMFCSTFARTTAQALLLAYAALIAYNALVALLPLLGKLAVALGWKTFAALLPSWLWLASPVSGLLHGGARDALVTLTCCGFIAVVLQGLSIWRLPRTLEEKSFRDPLWRSTNRLVSPSVRAIRKRREGARGMLDRNPVLWLNFSRRNTWLFQLILLGVGCVAVAWVFAVRDTDLAQSILSVSFGGVGWLLHFGVQILILIAAARSFATEKQDGSLELLLTTPISGAQIVRGKILSIFLRFGVILALACLFQAARQGQLGIPGLSLNWLYTMLGQVSSICMIVCVGIFFSVWMKSVAQAIIVTILTTIVGRMIVGTVLSIGTAILITMSSVSFGMNSLPVQIALPAFSGAAADLIIALIAYKATVKNLRIYAAR